MHTKSRGGFGMSQSKEGLEARKDAIEAAKERAEEDEDIKALDAQLKQIDAQIDKVDTQKEAQKEARMQRIFARAQEKDESHLGFFAENIMGAGSGLDDDDLILNHFGLNEDKPAFGSAGLGFLLSPFAAVGIWVFPVLIFYKETLKKLVKILLEL